MHFENELAEFAKRRARALEMGGAEKVITPAERESASISWQTGRPNFDEWVLFRFCYPTVSTGLTGYLKYPDDPVNPV
jgi:hypothetical protein